LGEELFAPPTEPCGEKQYEMLCKFAFDDYKMLVVDVKKSQTGYIRQYLWVSITLSGAQATLLANNTKIQTIIGFSPSPSYKPILTIALIVSVCVFTYCTHLLQRGGHIIIPVKTYGEACDYFCRSNPMLIRDKYKELLRVFDNARAEYSKEVSAIGIRLSWMSRVVITSISLTAVAMLHSLIGVLI
jgi:hypothetical protein